MSTRSFSRLSISLILFAGLVVPAALADHIETVGRLDLGEVLGPVPEGYRIAGIAHDGTDLWLVHPDGGRLLQVETEQGSLVGSFPIEWHAPVETAGLAYGDGNLWLLDAAQRGLLRLDRNGRVLSTTRLGSFQGDFLGIGFIPGDGDRPSRIVVAIGGAAGLPDRLLSWKRIGEDLRFTQGAVMPLQGATAMASTRINDVNYMWVSTPRERMTRIEGDAFQDGAQLPMEQMMVHSPDDLVPRGGQDWASTHRLALLDAESARVLWEVHPFGEAANDIATHEGMIFYPDGIGVIIAQLLQDYEVTYGACAIRDVKYTQTDWYIGDRAVNMSFAVPYDPDFGPPDPIFHEDGTGGYLAQELLAWNEMNPDWGIRHSEYTVIHGEANIRQGLHFPFDSTDTPRTEFEIRVKVCEASRNVDPARVGPFEWIPERERTLFFYDGDGDGWGDDDPTTCADDYYRLDSATVRRHTIDSGALAETNLYDRAKRIHEYVKRRHVYSGADGGWADPVKKLQSPYASCSPAAFMVVAMAREAGIPARLVGTTKQRGNLTPGQWSRDEAFHRWAQVYLPPYGWVRVDSTPVDPGTVGFRDVNADGNYDECDLCTTDAQCQADYDLSFSDCNITDPPWGTFVNWNDDDGDGDVDGDDVERISNWYWTQPRLDGGFAAGIGMKDLITVTAVGVPDNVMDQQYIAEETDHVGIDCDPHMSHGEQWRRFTTWSNPGVIFLVGVFLPAAGADSPATVTWDVDGPFTKDDLVRIDLYELISQGQQAPPRYRFIRNLARDVSIYQRQADVDLGTLPDTGDLVVVVTSQGGTQNDWFTSLAQADWETFGASAVLPR